MPADALLLYSWSVGRVARDDGPDQGNAVYDAAGLPVWVSAFGLPVAGSIDPLG